MIIRCKFSSAVFFDVYITSAECSFQKNTLLHTSCTFNNCSMGATGPIGLPGATDPTGFSGASILPTTNVWTGSNSFNNGITTGDINCSGNIDKTSSNENLKLGYQAFNSNTTGT